MPETLVSAGNTLVPCILALRAQGFTVSMTATEGRERWKATKADLALVAEDPLALLGLASLRESRGPEWHATDQEIDEVLREFYPNPPG